MNTINYFVQAYKLSHDEVEGGNDQKYLQWAIDCLKKLRALKMLDNAQKWCHFDIQTSPDGEKWAHLPKDYRRYLWIGQQQCASQDGNGNWYGRGNFVSFDLSNDLCDIAPWDSCACNAEMNMNTVQSCCNGGGGSGQWDGGLYFGYGGGEPYSYSYSMGSYAIGPGNVPHVFKIDTANNIIRFDRCVYHACMKYEGDFLTGMGNCFIPPGIEDNMIIQHWMEWRSKIISPDRIMRSEADTAWRNCFQGIRDYNSQRNALNYSEWLDDIRRFTYQGVKA